MTLRATTMAASLALMLAASPSAFAQQHGQHRPQTAPTHQTPISGGSSGGVAGQNVSASTYGQGTTDGSSLGVSGGGAATALNGEATTDSQAHLNQNRAMQRSTATAQTEDEMARSRTRTVVRNGEDVRSRTTSMYRDGDGGQPVRERVCTRSTPEGTVTTDCRGPN